MFKAAGGAVLATMPNSNFKLTAKRTFIVGLDGSSLSMRSVMVAAMHADQYNDNLIIVTLGKSDGDRATIFDRFASQAKDIAMRCGHPFVRIATEYVEVPRDMSLADTLIELVDRGTQPVGGTVLVMGAAGKGDEGRNQGRKPAGQPPMGSLAFACLEQCKQPVILVKSGPAPPTGGERIKRAGLDGTKGLNLMVTVEKDASAHVSRKAFDMALGFGTKGLERKFDTVFLYHVKNGGDDSAFYEEYKEELEKLNKGGMYKETSCVIEPKKHEIRQHIEEFVEAKNVDLLVMGSVELSEAGGRHLGSVTTAVAKSTIANVCVVKNYAYTWC